MNRSQGAAVEGQRAQADRKLYRAGIKAKLRLNVIVEGLEDHMVEAQGLAGPNWSIFSVITGGARRRKRGEILPYAARPPMESIGWSVAVAGSQKPPLSGHVPPGEFQAISRRVGIVPAKESLR
jgi:hypothetical protein